MPKLKREAVADLVREMIEDGTLKPGSVAPSGAALAREAGCSVPTGRAALRMLLADGTLTPGVSRSARPRVAHPEGAFLLDAEALREALSSALAARRRASGMTQPELAAKIGMSVTSVGHAETGRVWQSRNFWQLADQVLDAAGDLLGMYDQFTAAGLAPREEDDAARTDVALPVSLTITRAGVTVLWPDGSETVARPPATAAGEGNRACPDAEAAPAPSRSVGEANAWPLPPPRPRRCPPSRHHWEVRQ